MPDGSTSNNDVVPRTNARPGVPAD